LGLCGWRFQRWEFAPLLDHQVDLEHPRQFQDRLELRLRLFLLKQRNQPGSVDLGLESEILLGHAPRFADLIEVPEDRHGGQRLDAYKTEAEALEDLQHGPQR
jgi:hypothetical protein